MTLLLFFIRNSKWHFQPRSLCDGSPDWPDLAFFHLSSDTESGKKKWNSRRNRSCCRCFQSKKVGGGASLLAEASWDLIDYTITATLAVTASEAVAEPPAETNVESVVIENPSLVPKSKLHCLTLHFRRIVCGVWSSLETRVDGAIGLHCRDEHIEDPEEEKYSGWNCFNEFGSTEFATNFRMSSG